MTAGTPNPLSGSLEEPLAGGRAYSCPVDSECKSRVIRPWSIATPHFRAFHLAWISFFVSFFATFAPAALVTTIRENLSLTTAQINNANIAAVVSAVGSRIGMGTLVDTVGPRYGGAFVLCLSAPSVFLMSMVTGYGGYLAIRFFIGLSLCMFVACQFWVGSMFSVNIVGTANAIAGGWGNMGGGATLLLMPLFFAGIQHTSGVQGFEAWRWCFFIAGAFFLAAAALALMVSEDAPQGDYRDMKKNGVMAKGQAWKVFTLAVCNYRTWVMALTYGFCFGVELSVDNIIAAYFYDQFGLSQTTAGALGAIFGLMNIFSRATGGALSDLAAAHFGMRGRLWTLWILQTLGGVFCLLLYYVDYALGPTVAILIVFSIFVQQACGATYGIVPFISRRAYGVVAGVVGGGGNTGAGITQALWFGSTFAYQLQTTGRWASWSSQDGFLWMGVNIIIVSMFIFTVHFPMWGSMLFPGNPETTEEEYYIKEWTAEEVVVGLHAGAMRFANESRSQRYGSRHSAGGSLKGGSVKGGSLKGFKGSDSGAVGPMPGGENHSGRSSQNRAALHSVGEGDEAQGKRAVGMVQLEASPVV